MEYSSHSKMFQDIASIYIKDGEVIKYRGGDIIEVTDELITNEIKNRNKVIVEENKYLRCYFKDDDKSILEDRIRQLKEVYNMSCISEYVEIVE
ncbi:hypothetical protein [uncultured Clostridium sp.]|uniref:hypothetical protein n=1 Tax=uncultured Clostridium sp. TaxID=59620 RepID=UPI003218073B